MFIKCLLFCRLREDAFFLYPQNPPLSSGNVLPDFEATNERFHRSRETLSEKTDDFHPRSRALVARPSRAFSCVRPVSRESRRGSVTFRVRHRPVCRWRRASTSTTAAVFHVTNGRRLFREWIWRFFGAFVASPQPRFSSNSARIFGHVPGELLFFVVFGSWFSKFDRFPRIRSIRRLKSRRFGVFIVARHRDRVVKEFSVGWQQVLEFTVLRGENMGSRCSKCRPISAGYCTKLSWKTRPETWKKLTRIKNFWRRKCVRRGMFRNVELRVEGRFVSFNPYFVCNMAVGSLCDLYGVTLHEKLT